MPNLFHRKKRPVGISDISPWYPDAPQVIYDLSFLYLSFLSNYIDIHLSTALHLPGCGYQPSEDGVFLLLLPHGLLIITYHKIQYPSLLLAAGLWSRSASFQPVLLARSMREYRLRSCGLRLFRHPVWTEEASCSLESPHTLFPLQLWSQATGAAVGAAAWAALLASFFAAPCVFIGGSIVNIAKYNKSRFFP